MHQILLSSHVSKRVQCTDFLQRIPDTLSFTLVRKSHLKCMYFLLELMQQNMQHSKKLPTEQKTNPSLTSDLSLWDVGKYQIWKYVCTVWSGFLNTRVADAFIHLYELHDIVLLAGRPKNPCICLHGCCSTSEGRPCMPAACLSCSYSCLRHQPSWSMETHGVQQNPAGLPARIMVNLGLSRGLFWRLHSQNQWHRRILLVLCS